ncbi:MAG: carboxypeptidase-like regulatory domain-containing protein, partial [Bryobacteraceae bacterium]
MRICTALVFSAASLFGQAFTGSISGLVKDPTGAVVNGAVIIVTDVARGTQHKTVSNDTGLYVVPQLQPSTFRITAEAAGFRKYTLDGMPLSTQQSATVNITMELGSV